MSGNAELYFGFLIYIASSDGSISKDEVEFISESIEGFGLEDVLKKKLWGMLDKAKKSGCSDDLAWLVDESKKADPGLIMTMVRDGYALIEADGVEDEREIACLVGFLDRVFGAGKDDIDSMIGWSKKSLRVKEEGERIFLV